MCCSPWDRKESDMTERLNWTELNLTTLVSRRRKCLEDRHIGGARKMVMAINGQVSWHAAVHGVAKSRTQLSN